MTLKLAAKCLPLKSSDEAVLECSCSEPTHLASHLIARYHSSMAVAYVTDLQVRHAVNEEVGQ